LDIGQKFWLTWALVGLAFELAVLFMGREDLTLSWNIWRLRGTGIFSLIVFFLGWAIYHFVFEGRQNRGP
jgi:hypothetical protein